MAFEDLFKGLDMFKQGVQEYHTSKAINEATDQLKELSASNMDQTEKNTATLQLGQQVAMHLQALGAPQDRIKGTQSAIQSQLPTNAADANMMALLTGKSSYGDIAKQAQNFGMQPEITKLGIENQNKLQQIGLENKGKLDVAAMRRPGEGMSALTDAANNKLTEHDTLKSNLQDLQGQIDTGLTSVGPVAGRNPIRALKPNDAAFDAQLGQMIALYKKNITGTGMSAEESKMLAANMPSSNDTTDVFRAKTKNMSRLADLQKALDLKNMHKSAFNIGGHAEDLQAYANAHPKDPRFKQFRTATTAAAPERNIQVIEYKGQKIKGYQLPNGDFQPVE